MYCTKCGKVVESDEEYCSYCGTKVKNSSKTDASKATRSISGEEAKTKSGDLDETSQKPSSKKTIGFVIVLIIVVITACIVIPSVSDTYKKPINIFMDGLSNSDYETIDEIVAPDCMGDINTWLNLNMAIAAGYQWDFSIEEAVKLDKYELAELADIYFYEYSDVRVTSGYVVTGTAVGYSAEDPNKPAYADTWKFTVAKINGLRYIVALQCNKRFSDYDEQSSSFNGQSSAQGTSPTAQPHASLTLNLPVGTVLEGYLAAGTQYTAVLNSDATVTCYGGEGSGIDTSTWRDIIAISGYDDHVVGLCSDGSLVGTGQSEEGCLNLEGWMDITEIATGYHSTVALTEDGYVKYTGTQNYSINDCVNWSDIETLVAGDDHMAGILFDGSMVASGYNTSGQCDVGDFKDIICAAVGCQYTFVVHEDGSVDVIGGNAKYAYGQTDAMNWSDIIAIDSGDQHVVGLTKDGRVLAAGDNSYGQCNVDHWTNIVAICAGRRHTVAIDNKGNLYMTGDNTFGQCMGNGD